MSRFSFRRAVEAAPVIAEPAREAVPAAAAAPAEAPAPFSIPAEGTPVVPQPVDPLMEVRLKLHGRLIEEIDLSKLDKLDEDEMRRQVRRTDPARTGEAITVDDEDLVRHRVQPVELFQEVAVVEPADATSVAIEQTGPVKQERSGAHADQRHPRLRGPAEKVDIFAAKIVDLVD